MENEIVRGYKVFNPDWTCRAFQYEVGKIFEEDVVPECCERGFHFCTKASDCFNYYNFDNKNHVAEVIALGDVDYEEGSTKCCTNKISIVREIPWSELLTIVNEGKDCTGLCNTGNRNTGNRNTGDWNTGNCNTGDWNTGDCNTGDWNTGDWNASSFNTGCFCTEDHNLTMFNKPSGMGHDDWRRSDARSILYDAPSLTVQWISDYDMSEEEKAEHEDYKTTGGYLKVMDERESRQAWWDGLSVECKKLIFDLPNFDADVFKKCTGIEVTADER